MDKIKINNLRKRREKLLNEYKKLSKVLSKRNFFTKKEALKRVYEVNPEIGGSRLQARIRVPISLMGLKVKLTEVKPQPSTVAI